MRDRRFQWIPVCTAHEVRRDFRDALVDAVLFANGRAGFESLWKDLGEAAVDALWAREAPALVDDAARRIRILDAAAHTVLLIARSAAKRVAGELPSVEPLGANLRLLLRGDPLRTPGHLLVAFDDQRLPCVGWVGHWGDTSRLLERLARLAEQTVPVLIRGETGTGKEVVARGIHVLGRRREKPYLAINCAELPPTIVETELFGHVRGAFTGAAVDRIGLFEAAGDGTVFLDEIGELPVAAQAKLLRVLEEHSVRRIGSSQSRPLACRVIAATNRDLGAEIAQRGFRADLFYRLRGSEIVLAPLRERRDDILALTESFVARAALRFRKAAIDVEEDAKLALLSHPWPGNVRELRQTIEEAVLATADQRLAARHLGFTPTASVDPPPSGEPLLTARAVERQHILRALASTDGNKMAAARILGLSRQSLERRMVRHGISIPSGSGRPRLASLPDVGPIVPMRLTHSKEIR